MGFESIGNLHSSNLKNFQPNWYVDKSPYKNQSIFVGLIYSGPSRYIVKTNDIKIIIDWYLLKIIFDNLSYFIFCYRLNL